MTQWTGQVLLVLATLLGAHSLFRGYARLGVPPDTPAEDCGNPLYLTPYIRANRTDEARQLANVSYPAFRNVISYSGFLTVNENFQSNMFFWYFPAESGSGAPVVLWLQGGPGASSLYGLFSENGPFEYRRGRVLPRKYSWSRNHHVLYIDNPVGTGFSNTNGGYAQNETAVGRDLYAALLQFFQLFPDIRYNQFFVTGESYAGKYVPALCYTIYRENLNSTQQINLHGFAIGNGLSDPENQLIYAPYLYQLGLLDRKGFEKVSNLEEQGIAYIKARKWMDAYKVFDMLLNGDVYPYPTLFANLTGYKYYFNYLFPEDTTHSDDFAKLFAQPEFRRAIHVGRLPFQEGGAVELQLREDMMQSVAPWVAELLGHYRGVIYNGQLDIIVAYPLTENYLARLDFSSAEEWREARRGQWLVGGQLAGYAKVAGNLTEVLVRAAGHMVPADQPQWAADLLTRLTSNKPFF